MVVLLPPATKLGKGYVHKGGGVPDLVRGVYLVPGDVPGRGGVPGPGGVHPPPRTRYTPWDQVHPPDQLPPGTRYTPQTRYTPLDQVSPWDQVHPRDQVHPPCAEHAGRYGQRAGGTHPTGMQSCLNCTFY